MPCTFARQTFTIEETSEVKKKSLGERQKVLHSQKYSKKLVQEVILKATSIPVETLLPKQLKLKVIRSICYNFQSKEQKRFSSHSNSL